MARRLAFVLTCALWLTACPRGARPVLGEDRLVMAGVDVCVGSADPEAPELSFDFGDGSAPVVARQARHAYARSGSYVLSARREGNPVGAVKLTVVPRPLTAAVPAEASSVIFLPKVAGHLDSTIDFLEKLLGAEAVQDFLDATVLPALAIELPSAESPAVDPQEGLGIFTLPQFEGTVVLLGVIDDAKAQDVLVKQLERRGGYARQEVDRTVRVRLPRGRELAIFVDRGYLYVALPEAKEFEPPDPQDPGLSGLPPMVDVEPAVAAVRQASDEGLSKLPAMVKARARLPAGDAFVYLASPPSPVRKIDGLFAALTLSDRVLELDGLISADKPLWSAEAMTASGLLGAAPTGAVAAAYASVPPAELAALLTGAAGTPRRQAAADSARRSGLDLEALLAALTGDLSALVYFDAEATLANLATGSDRPEPRGTLLLEAGTARQGPVEDLVRVQLTSAGVRYDRVDEAGVTRYLARLRDQPFELRLTPGRARLTAGGSLDARANANLTQALQLRFGDAFGPGHVSVMVDLGQLRRELAEPRSIAGIDPRRLVMVQGIANSLLQRTPIDTAFLDVSPDADGARVKGRLTLKEK